MKETNVRVGIIGMGNMGSDHARRIVRNEVPGLSLRAVFDEDPSRVSSWHDRPGVTVYSNLTDALQADIDAVIIATPHFSHTTIGIQALRTGLHVLVEKPISVHTLDGERLIAAHTRKEQVFAAMFNQRTDPAYVKLKELIVSGELGALRRVTWIITDWYRTQAYYNSGKWRATWAGEGGGVLMNQCPHQLDLYQWLFGMPATVRAFCETGRFHDIEVEDSVTGYFEHANGTRGVFITTTGEAPGTNRLEVAGDRGKVVVENGQFQWSKNEVPAQEFSQTSSEGFAKPGVSLVTLPMTGSGEQHAGILKNFAAACLTGFPLIAPAADGLRSVELANAMLLSSARGETITLPLDGESYRRWLEDKIANSRHRSR